MRKSRKLCFLSMLLLAACLCGCGDSAKTPKPSGPRGEGEPSASGSYQAPEFADAVFHEDKAQGTQQVQLDVSAVSQGYVAVSARSGKRIKFRVSMGEVQYNYDVANDGTPCIFPLQSGDGAYSFDVLEQVVNTSYTVLYSADCEVVMEDEFQPFLRPSEYSKYDKDSACVKRAADLAAAQPDMLGVVSAVFDDICSNISYDTEKALALSGATGYMPNPDDTLDMKKGICFDYAALAAAMLRSQGIPAKIVFGYVSPDDLYHAWNMFYTTQTGWVNVGYDVKAGSWYRMDTTFSAAGTDNSFVGDGGNYVDAKYY